MYTPDKGLSQKLSALKFDNVAALSCLRAIYTVRQIEMTLCRTTPRVERHDTCVSCRTTSVGLCK
jgi:hypothetical protein